MNTILFDLDGTLLPMDQDAFLKHYFYQLSDYFAPKGISTGQLIQSINKGMKGMILNDGSMTNEQRFWEIFSSEINTDANQLMLEFENFYETNFQDIKITTSLSEYANKSIQLLKAKGYTVAIATNPVFPPIATLSRIRWAGLSAEDFVHITTYDNSSYCKPNLNYYLEIIQRLKKDPKDCMMVGNDVTEDMVTAELGMDTYLLTDCLINKNETPIDSMKHGSFSDFYRFVQTLPEVSKQ